MGEITEFKRKNEMSQKERGAIWKWKAKAFQIKELF